MAFSSHPFFFFFFLVLGFASSTTFLSYDIFESGGSSTGGRALLQAQKNCPVNFENQNYTIITSKCKGPNYPAKSCCDALKDFACPFTNEINDLKNDCASTMFSYINIYGKYPPGLFASQCREGKEGLACPAEAPKSDQKNSRSHISATHSIMLTLTATLLVLSSFYRF